MLNKLLTGRVLLWELGIVGGLQHLLYNSVESK